MGFLVRVTDTGVFDRPAITHQPFEIIGEPSTIRTCDLCLRRAVTAPKFTINSRYTPAFVHVGARSLALKLVRVTETPRRGSNGEWAFVGKTARTLAALALCASPAWSATLPAEIIITDMGFRQLADCHEAWPRRVWKDGHYWSVRPTWVCTDEPYVGGKGGVMALLDPDLMPWPTLSAPPAPSRPVGAPYTASDLTPGHTPGQPPPWGIPPRPPHGPTPLPPINQPIPPIPLPGSLWLLALAIGAFGAIKWRKT